MPFSVPKGFPSIFFFFNTYFSITLLLLRLLKCVFIGYEGCDSWSSWSLVSLSYTFDLSLGLGLELIARVQGTEEIQNQLVKMIHAQDLYIRC